MESKSISLSKRAQATPAGPGAAQKERGGAMHSARSAAFRRTLMERRSQLLNQVEEIESDLGWLQTNVEPELLEEGQEQALANVLERLDEHDRVELEAIDRALERIRHGRYGACEICGEAIPLARQLAVPTAGLCRPCAESPAQSKET